MISTTPLPWRTSAASSSAPQSAAVAPLRPSPVSIFRWMRADPSAPTGRSRPTCSSVSNELTEISTAAIHEFGQVVAGCIQPAHQRSPVAGLPHGHCLFGQRNTQVVGPGRPGGPGHRDHAVPVAVGLDHSQHLRLRVPLTFSVNDIVDHGGEVNLGKSTGHVSIVRRRAGPTDAAAPGPTLSAADLDHRVGDRADQVPGGHGPSVLGRRTGRPGRAAARRPRLPGSGPRDARARSRPDQPRQGVAGPRCGQRGGSHDIDVGVTVRIGDDCARALEHHDAPQASRQPRWAAASRSSPTSKPSRANSPTWGVMAVAAGRDLDGGAQASTVATSVNASASSQRQEHLPPEPPAKVRRDRCRPRCRGPRPKPVAAVIRRPRRAHGVGESGHHGSGHLGAAGVLPQRTMPTPQCRAAPTTMCGAPGYWRNRQAPPAPRGCTCSRSLRGLRRLTRRRRCRAPEHGLPGRPGGRQTDVHQFGHTPNLSRPGGRNCPALASPKVTVTSACTTAVGSATAPVEGSTPLGMSTATTQAAVRDRVDQVRRPGGAPGRWHQCPRCRRAPRPRAAIASAAWRRWPPPGARRQRRGPRLRL